MRLPSTERTIFRYRFLAKGRRRRLTGSENKEQAGYTTAQSMFVASWGKSFGWEAERA